MTDAKTTLLGRAVRGAAYGLAATTAVLALTVAPAQAQEDTPDGDASICAGGRFCMWEDANYSGSRYANWPPTGVNQKFQLDGWNGDNEITSLVNNTRYRIRVYDKDDYSGDSRCVDPGESVRNLKETGDFNDQIESAKTVSSC